MSQITAFDGTLGQYVTEIGDGMNDALRVNIVAAGCEDVVLLPSSARTASWQSADQVNHGFTSALINLHVSVYNSSGNITLELLWKDPAAGDYVALMTKTIAGTGDVGICVGFGSNAVANFVAADCSLPPTWAVKVVPPDGASNTYSVGVSLMQ